MTFTLKKKIKFVHTHTQTHTQTCSPITNHLDFLSWVLWAIDWYLYYGSIISVTYEKKFDVTKLTEVFY